MKWLFSFFKRKAKSNLARNNFYMLLIYKFSIFNAFRLKCWKPLPFDVNKKTWKQKCAARFTFQRQTFHFDEHVFGVKKNAFIINIREHCDARNHALSSDLSDVLALSHSIAIIVSRSKWNILPENVCTAHLTLSMNNTKSCVSKHGLSGRKEKVEIEETKKNNANK